MKLSKTKKIILLTVGLALLTTSIVTPIVILNKDENDKDKDENDKDQKDVDKVVKILEEKNDKTIVLPSDASGKIIANNQEKILEKIKALIGQSNLKEVKIEVSMQNDTNISIDPQKIIIKLTKNKISKEIKDFLLKRDLNNTELANKDIASIKKILDGKIGKDLIIILSGDSTGRIMNINNKNEIEKKLRILIDPSNIDGDPNHQSLKGTNISINVIINIWEILKIPKDIIVSISKTGGTTVSIINKFQVRKA